MDGGSTCAAMTLACKDWGLKKSLTNSIYALSRIRFKPLSIYRFEIGDNQNETRTVDPKDKKIMAGFHNYSFGSTADIVVMSEKLRYCKESRYKIAAHTTILFQRKIRKIRFWTTDEKLTKDQMPDINEKVPDSWQYHEGSIYDILCSWYPFFTRDFTITKKTKWESDFSVVSLTPSSGGCCGLLKMLKQAEDGTLDESKVVKRWESRAFRFELAEDPKKFNQGNSPISIDGDVFRGTILQGF